MRCFFLFAFLFLIFGGCSIPGPSEEERKDSAVLPVYNISLPSGMAGYMYYAQAGDPQGQRVVFLHGTPGSRNAWAGYMANVPAGRQYIAVDRPAFGQSGPRQVLSIWQQADIIAELLKPNEDVSAPVLIGHSYGATLAAVIAALYPDKVAAVIIVAGSVSPHLDNQKPLFRFFSYPPMRYLVPRSLNKANDEVIALEEEAKRFPELWKNLRMPVFVLQGSKDPLVSVENVIYMRREMVNAQLDITVLAGAGHFLIWDEGDKVKRLITRALASIDRKESI